ncbi:uncharacterized protein [Montipora foliosa]
MNKGKLLLSETRTQRTPVSIAAIISVQRAFEVLKASINSQVTVEHVGDLLKTIEPYVYRPTPLIQAMCHSWDIFSDPRFERHERVLFVLSDSQRADGSYPHQKLIDLGVTIINCFITDQSWDPSKFTFRVSSITYTPKIPRTLLQSRRWDMANANIKMWNFRAGCTETRVQVTQKKQQNDDVESGNLQQGNMLYLTGILVNVSDSNWKALSGKLESEGGSWARFLLKVINELINSTLPFSKETFVLAFGLDFHPEPFDLWSSLVEANKEQFYIETLRSRETKEEIINEVLNVLEKNGAGEVRTWVQNWKLVAEVLDPSSAAAILYHSQQSPNFAERCVECLPSECHNKETGSGSWVPRLLGASLFSFVLPPVAAVAAVTVAVGVGTVGIVSSASKNRKNSVQEAMSKVKILLSETRTAQRTAVSKAAIFSAQSACEVLKTSIENQLTAEHIEHLIETIKPCIYWPTLLIQDVRHSLDIFSDPQFERHEKLLFVLSDSQQTDGSFPHQKLIDFGVTIINCFVTDQRRPDSHQLSCIAQESWDPSKYTFRVSSITFTPKILPTLSQNRRWDMANSNIKTWNFHEDDKESILMGILVDVSGSMRNSASGKLKGDNGPWARSVFKVVEELIKHDVPSSNQTFALAFGGRFGSQVFDFLSTLGKANEEKSAMEALKSEKSKEDIINEGLDILETKGAERVRTWGRMNVLLKVIDDTTAAAILYYLQRSSLFTRKFVYEILPRECREIVIQPDSLIKEGAYKTASEERKEWATEESVKETIEKGKQLLEEWRMVDVCKAAIMSFQTASEIQHASKGDHELTNERINELMKTVEPYIYGKEKEKGKETPLITAMRHSKELFSHPQFANHKKLLFILSGGLSTDGNDPPLQALSDLGVTTVSCFITHENISNPRRLYGIPHGTWREPAKFMFRISSTMKTQEIPRALFAKKGKREEWEIDFSNNETRLFFQVNHPDVIKEVCDMAKRAVLSQDALSDVLSEIDLNVYINRANKRFKPTTQKGETCFAHASAAVMHLAIKRRIGECPKFDDLVEELVTKHGKKGAPVFDVLREECPKYRLKCRRVDTVKAKRAISEKRPVVATFFLTGAQWDLFDQFYEENGKGILTKSDLISETDSASKGGRHAVVLTSYDAESLRLMNSYGEDFADGGFFRVQEASVLGLEFIDVYWDWNDLSEEEKRAYKKHGAEVAGDLMKLKGLQVAKYKCPLCHAESKVVEYSGHALNAKCPKCKGSFNPNKEENGDLALNLYLTSLLC